jgi:hypothetical protein
MDGKFQPSFIPKKSLIVSDKPVRHGSFGFLTLIAVTLLLASLAAAGGVVAWQKLLAVKIQQNEETLKKTRDQFDPALIQELKRMNTRIEVAKDLLNNHLSVSSFFALLSELTLKSVRFKNFSYSIQGNKVSVTMRGDADNYKAVALQSDVFGKNKYILEPIISNLSPEAGGNVAFDFSALIDPSIVLFKNGQFKPAAPATTTQQ